MSRFAVFDLHDFHGRVRRADFQVEMTYQPQRLALADRIIPLRTVCGFRAVSWLRLVILRFALSSKRRLGSGLLLTARHRRHNVEDTTSARAVPVPRNIVRIECG